MTYELNDSIFEESVILRSKSSSIKFQSGVKQSAKCTQKFVKKTASWQASWVTSDRRY